MVSISEVTEITGSFTIVLPAHASKTASYVFSPVSAFFAITKVADWSSIGVPVKDSFWTLYFSCGTAYTAKYNLYRSSFVSFSCFLSSVIFAIWVTSGADLVPSKFLATASSCCKDDTFASKSNRVFEISPWFSKVIFMVFGSAALINVALTMQVFGSTVSGIS